MRETTTDTPDEKTHPNIAFAHDYVNDTVRVIPRYATDNIGPAGAMYSSVSDMAIWMRFLLDSARLGGKRVLSARGYADLFAPHILVDDKEFYPTAKLTHPRFQAYGQGWFLEDYRGEFVAFHTGSIDGMVAIVGLDSRAPPGRRGLRESRSRRAPPRAHVHCLRSLSGAIEARLERRDAHPVRWAARGGEEGRAKDRRRST